MPESTSIPYDLIPSDTAILDEDVALAAALVIDEPLAQPPSDAGDGTTPLGYGWLFDFEAGEFVEHGNAPARVSDDAQLQVWIEKAIRTIRFAHPIYSDDFGRASVPMIGQQVTPALLGLYATSIEQALLVHDRITDVRNFAFSQDPMDDLLECTFEYVRDEDDSDPLPYTTTLETR